MSHLCAIQLNWCEVVGLLCIGGAIAIALSAIWWAIRNEPPIPPYEQHPYHINRRRRP